MIDVVTLHETEPAAELERDKCPCRSLAPAVDREHHRHRAYVLYVQWIMHGLKMCARDHRDGPSVLHVVCCSRDHIDSDGEIAPVHVCGEGERTARAPPISTADKKLGCV